MRTRRVDARGCSARRGGVFGFVDSIRLSVVAPTSNGVGQHQARRSQSRTSTGVSIASSCTSRSRVLASSCRARASMRRHRRRDRLPAKACPRRLGPGFAEHDVDAVRLQVRQYMARGHEVGQDVLGEPPAHAVHAIVEQAGRLAAPAERGDCTQRALGEFTQALAEAPSVRVVGEVGLQGGENPAVALAQRREHARLRPTAMTGRPAAITASHTPWPTTPVAPITTIGAVTDRPRQSARGPCAGRAVIASRSRSRPAASTRQPGLRRRRAVSTPRETGPRDRRRSAPAGRAFQARPRMPSEAAPDISARTERSQRDWTQKGLLRVSPGIRRGRSGRPAAAAGARVRTPRTAPCQEPLIRRTGPAVPSPRALTAKWGA